MMRSEKRLKDSSRNTMTTLLLIGLLSGCTTAGRVSNQASSASSIIKETPLASITETSSAEACRLTALKLAENERDEAAIEQLLRARKISPNHEGISHPLAVLYDRLGQVDSAEREYQRALKESPNDPDLLNDFGYFQYSQGRLVEAQPLLQRAMQLAADHPKATINLALVTVHLGNYDEAKRLFTQALGPGAAEYNLGMVRASQGQVDRAKEHFELAAGMNPGLPLTDTALSFLESQVENGAMIQQASVDTESGAADNQIEAAIHLQ